MKKIFFLMLLWPSLSFALPFSQQIQIPVTKTKLKNGLTVLLHEDHSIPSFSFHQWFRVGSVNEKVGRTGLAHFFEHLMFKGTAAYPKGTMDRLIQANGGNSNAFTSHDYTGYYVNLPADKLPLIIKIEADRMQNLLFDPKEIQSEREVVKEERRMRVENDVGGTLAEAIYKTVFTQHPYHWPVIGYMDDLNAASLEDLKQFYKTYYSPNNAVVVISGSFDSKEALKLIQKYYEPIPAQAVPELKPPSDPEPNKEKRLEIAKEVQSITYGVVYPIVEAGHPDSFALDLLSNVMTQGISSRLYKRLVYDMKVATGVGSTASTPKFPGMFQIEVEVKPGLPITRSLQAIDQEIELLQNKELSTRELEKAKNQVLKSYVDGLKTVAGKARILAYSEVMFGDYQEIFRHLDRYQGVTAKEIKNVANRYLKTNRRSVVQVVPKKS